MMSRCTRLMVASTIALLVAGGLAGCGDDIDAGAPSGSEPTVSDSQGGDANNGRAFDSTDEAVIIATEAALSSKNAKAEWRGSVLYVALEGSAESPTASILCSAPEAVIAAEESVVLVYPDGEIICDDRPGGRRS